jgi:ubiquinone/menaquinone biosynthesis C-methylase UbiE
MSNSDVREWGNTRGSLNYFLEQKIPKSSSVLDIGCHAGTLVNSIWLEGYRSISGIDNNSASISKGKQKYQDIADRLIHYNGDKLPYENNQFDVVTMFDVLEHIEDIHNYLAHEVRRILKPGGRLIFQTPNRITNIPWEILSHKSLTYYRNYHVSLQTYSSLSQLLESTGFVEVTIEKQDLRVPYYVGQLNKYIGIFAYPVLMFVNLLPVQMSTNFWGYGRTKT